MGASEPTDPEGPGAAPPHSIEAEQAVLGGLLFDNELFSRLGDRLKPEHFYDPVHGKIFEACARLIRANRLADGHTLREFFMRNDGIAEIGGAAYIVTLLENAARFQRHAEEYAELILDLHTRRALIRIGQEIATMGRAPPEGVGGQEMIELSEGKLFQLAQSGQEHKGFAPFSQALAASIDMISAAAKNRDDVSGLRTGFADLDRLMGGLHRSDLIILAGRPSMGKTALATNIAYNVAYARLMDRRDPKSLAPDDKLAGGVVAFFSLEMSAEQLSTRLLSEATEIESTRLRRGNLHKEEIERVRDKGVELATLPLMIDETGAINIAQLQARARRLSRMNGGIDLVVVDYLQLVTSAQRRSEGRVQEVSEITQGLKALAKDLKVPVVALSQLSRQVEMREDKRPQLADLRESGSIEQDADVVLFVYRESYYLERQEPDAGTDKHFQWQEKVDRLRNQAEVIVGKNRHGPIDKVRLHFDGRFTKFSNLAPGQRGGGGGDEH